MASSARNATSADVERFMRMQRIRVISFISLPVWVLQKD
jgi:hypothetical protein